MVSATSARPSGGRPAVPAKMTSSILPPRSDFAPCSPITQARASTTLDLPDPLGPTMQVMPGSSWSVVAEAKDLKPAQGQALQVHVGSSPRLRASPEVARQAVEGRSPVRRTSAEAAGGSQRRRRRSPGSRGTRETVDPWSVVRAGTGRPVRSEEPARSRSDRRARWLVAAQTGCIVLAGILVRHEQVVGARAAATSASFSACEPQRSCASRSATRSSEAAVLPTRSWRRARVGPGHVADEGLRHGGCPPVGDLGRRRRPACALVAHSPAVPDPDEVQGMWVRLRASHASHRGQCWSSDLSRRKAQVRPGVALPSPRPRGRG